MCEGEKQEVCGQLFSGSGTNAMAALLQSFSLTDEQIKELEEILEKSKGNSSDRSAHLLR